MIPVDPNNVMCDAPEEGAALGLLGLMTGISEELYCAGWIIGLERSMWAVREGGPRKFGLGKVTERQAQLLLLLSEECDGWWAWDEARGPVFQRLAKWRDHLNPAVGALSGAQRSELTRSAPDEPISTPPPPTDGEVK